jgi:hypothetical protein
MAGNPEIVDEFRSIVTTVINNQVTEAQSQHISWPGYDRISKKDSLFFASVDRKHPRPSIFGFSEEHMWGIAEYKGLRYGRQIGSIAVVSYSEDNESLHRVLTLHSAMQVLGISRKLCLDEDQMKTAIDWARSPHVYLPQLIDAVGSTEDEIPVIDEQLKENSEAHEALQRGLDSLARMHRQPIPTTGPIY